MGEKNVDLEIRRESSVFLKKGDDPVRFWVADGQPFPRGAAFGNLDLYCTRSAILFLVFLNTILKVYFSYLCECSDVCVVRWMDGLLG